MSYPFEKLKLSIYGESHAASIGMSLLGLPEGTNVDLGDVDTLLRDRKAKGEYSTPRQEKDEYRIISGMRDGKTDGERIQAEIPNSDVRREDYGNTAVVPRPSHADYVSYVKYGKIPTGGGRFSGRMTAPLCIAGGICERFLKERGVTVAAYVAALAGVKGKSYKNCEISKDEALSAREKPLFMLSGAEEAKAVLNELRKNGDSAGGIVECIVYGLKPGIGDAIADGLESLLSGIIYSIPAVKGVEFGTGFDFAMMKGSEANDAFIIKNGKVGTETNHSGGINGGISNGENITLSVVFRPTPSISVKQRSVNLETFEEEELIIRGRHDVTVVPRATAAVKSAVILALTDALLAAEEKKC